MGRPLSFPLPLMGSFHTLPHTHSVPERNMYQHREKYLTVLIGIYVCLCAKGCLHAWCVLGGIWGVYGWCCIYQIRAFILALQIEIDMKTLLCGGLGLPRLRPW